MSKNINSNNFGIRLAELRKAAGLTQLELSNEVGISRRMIAYYEKQTKHPPASILPNLAKALHVTIDELFETKPTNLKIKVGSSRLQRKLQEIEKTDTKTKRQIMQLLDTFIEREKFKKSVMAK